MEYWSRKGRPMLLAALEAVCDSVEEDLTAENRLRDAHAQSLAQQLDQLKAAAAKADELEKENRSLLLEIEHLRSKHVATLDPPALEDKPQATTRPVLAELPVNAATCVVPRASLAIETPDKANLEKAYSRLARLHGALEKRHEATQQSARRFRESRDSWVAYSQSLEVKIKALEKKLHRNERQHDVSKFRDPQPPPDDLLSGHTALGSSFTSNPELNSASRPPQDDVAHSDGHSKPTPSPEPRFAGDAGRSADEETEDGNEEADGLPPLLLIPASRPAFVIKEEPSSDGPIIVSERAVRKRKHAEDNIDVPTPPRKIKSEHSPSSDPVIIGEARTFCPHESIDLDEEEQGVPTPRKLHRSDGLHIRTEEAAGAARHRPALPLPPPEARADKAMLDAASPSRGRVAHEASAVTCGLSTHRRTTHHTNGTPVVQARWTLDHGVADVAEDGFAPYHSTNPWQAERELNNQTPAPNRLHFLLHQDSPEKTAPFLPSTRLSRNGVNPRFDEEDTENVPPLGDIRRRPRSPFKASPYVQRSPAITPQRHAKSTANQQPRSRLRDRPLVELRSEDFKVNPKFNNGYKHAFTEVVRNKDERAELAGCTDPNCCGRHFRAMAESELAAGGPGILSRVADTKMMENYLGHEAHRLVDMTREERQQLWLQAKIQDLADRLGRHRHRFARRPSPPGYWNPDFPSTQELEQSKEEGERMERRVVEERWREAMRGGGRWLFRDE